MTSCAIPLHPTWVVTLLFVWHIHTVYATYPVSSWLDNGIAEAHDLPSGASPEGQ
jgi:hypothetical protein